MEGSAVMASIRDQVAAIIQANQDKPLKEVSETLRAARPNKNISYRDYVNWGDEITIQLDRERKRREKQEKSKQKTMF